MTATKEIKSKSKSVPARVVGDDDEDSLDIFAILGRQRWPIIVLTILGIAGGITYAIKARPWYTSNARVLINEKSAGLGSENSATDIVDEDILANHIELLQSRLIVGEALSKSDLMQLESIQSHLDEKTDAIDYVISQLSLTKGGSGSAKNARCLNISFTHTDHKDARLILLAVVDRYERFIVDQVEDVMGRANTMLQTAKDEVESELIAAEEEFRDARKAAPLFFQGEGSSNIYQDRFRRLQDQLLDIDIKESTISTRLQRVEKTIQEINQSNQSAVDQLDKLALIDSESLQRLGVFASLQMNSANSAEFRLAMPAKAEQARAEITHLLQLNSEKQRLEAAFGPGHPKVQEIQREIDTVQAFLKNSQDGTTDPTTMLSEESSLTPESLLKAYVGFLNHDLATFAEQRKELEVLAEDAEKKAKELIEFELTDLVLRKKIERQEALFDGVVQQLRDLDTASGLSGYLYEFLEVPQLGEQSWPKLPLCALGGCMLGLMGGLCLAVANEFRDGRFRSAAELDEVIGLQNLGMVAKLNSIRDGVAGLIAAENTPSAEAFRLGRTVLLSDIRGGKIHTLGFTSPMQGDGKSTITTNFAVSFAQIGLKYWSSTPTFADQVCTAISASPRGRD